MLYEIKSSYNSSFFGSNVEQWGETVYKKNRPSYDDDFNNVKTHLIEQYGLNFNDAKLTKLIGNVVSGVKCYTFGSNMIDFSHLCTVKTTGTIITFMDKQILDFPHPRNHLLTVYEHIITPAHNDIKYTGKYKGNTIGTCNMLTRKHDTIIYTIMKNNEILIKFYPNEPIKFNYEKGIQTGNTHGICVIETKKYGNFTYKYIMEVNNDYGLLNRKSDYRYVISRIE